MSAIQITKSMFFISQMNFELEKFPFSEPLEVNLIVKLVSKTYFINH